MRVRCREKSRSEAFPKRHTISFLVIPGSGGIPYSIDMEAMSQKAENFRKKIALGPVAGMFSKTSDPAFVEILGLAGHDFVILDMEHGPNDFKILENLIRAAALGGVLPIVRIKEGDLTQIGAALDLGAGGVQVPQIRSGEEAREAVRRARFGSGGERGVCRFVRAAGYSSVERNTYFREANRSLMILQLEGNQAIAALDDILEVEGIDVIFVGPYDLSQALGVPGEVNHPLVEREMKRVVEAASKKNIAVGNFTDTRTDLEKWKSLGVRYLSHGVDTGHFLEAARRMLGRD